MKQLGLGILVWMWWIKGLCFPRYPVLALFQPILAESIRLEIFHLDQAFELNSYPHFERTGIEAVKVETFLHEMNCMPKQTIRTLGYDFSVLRLNYRV